MRAVIVEPDAIAMTLATTLPCRPVTFGALGWLALHAAALWPHGLWAARRVADGSDDPLGLAALAALLVWLWRERERLRATPHLRWLGVAAVLTLAATAMLFVAPPLAAALLAALALAAHVAAWLSSSARAAAQAPTRAPLLALTGLALLALPLVASLQFYVGYPLRAFTAMFSAWLLQAVGIAAEPSGAAMTVAGQLVIVDAPCSGVQMAWCAWFAACATAAFTGLPDRALLRRLPLVSLAVLAGNVLRNSVLVALEARPEGLARWAHEALGLMFLIVVVSIAVRLTSPRRRGVKT
jgi:exosortase/archaeosortase family protein